MLSNDILPCCFQDEVKNPKLLTDDARPTAIGYPSVSNDLKKNPYSLYIQICHTPPPNKKPQPLSNGQWISHSMNRTLWIKP